MPAGGALFGSSATGPGSTGGNKHLVEMRAGKMNLKSACLFRVLNSILISACL